MSSWRSFETERLILRPTSIEDADFIFELLNTPKWLQNIGDRNIRTKEDAAAYIRNKMYPQLERLGFSNYTLIRKNDQEKVGSCGLYDREGLEGVDIGYALLPQFEGNGYAYEAAVKLKAAAHNEFGITIINGITSKENLSSQRLLEKLGLLLVGTTRLPGEDVDLLLFKTDPHSV
ncbi:GNAT family N-acetyltransferase [Salinimicrobium oceani]|uniref:GNAT family N-acetyltransferase n=1 Tax=Salinimicrobium oceani TaxID=2722702 RepID=A0ABX1CVJ7_9FLAO|nr:GNAT family N-acetyltransferase [Salinimicrobium oceani]NJW52315.1 GNAT family N-acetyltransferase [Salinimicrobium oceani]